MPLQANFHHHIISFLSMQTFIVAFYKTPQFLAQYETLGVWVVLEVEGELVQMEI